MRADGRAVRGLRRGVPRALRRRFRAALHQVQGAAAAGPRARGAPQLRHQQCVLHAFFFSESTIVAVILIRTHLAG